MKVVASKRGQQIMGMPFEIIFALFLIVVFIVIAFIAIRSFLDIGKTSEVGLFYEELQKNVDDAMREQTTKYSFEINLPKGIEKICFANLSERITNAGAEFEAIRYYEIHDANLFLIPPENAKEFEWKFIKHIDLEKITATSNPYCVDANDKLIIEKGFYDKLVWIR